MAKIKRHNLVLGVTLVAAVTLVTANIDEPSYIQSDFASEHHEIERWDTQNFKKHGSGLITRCEPPGTGGYFISKDKYSYAGAFTACKALGGSLADLSRTNFLLASDLVLSCAGPNKRAWIGTWDYSENQECLSIFVGNTGPGGGVDNTCPGDRPVLCQLHPPNSYYTPIISSYHSSAPVGVPAHSNHPHNEPYSPNYGNGYPNQGNPHHGHHGHGHHHGNSGSVNTGEENECHDNNNNACNVPITIYKTINNDGLVTTLTLSGVKATVTVNDVASVVTLDDIVSSFVVAAKAETITEIIDGVTVTVTKSAESSTVTMIGDTTIHGAEGCDTTSPSGLVASPTGPVFTFPFNVPGFNGPGIYTLSPGNVLQVKPDGTFEFLYGGATGVPTPTDSGLFPIQTSSTSSSKTGFPINVVNPDQPVTAQLPQQTLPTVDLGNGNTLSSYKGPGTYTLSPGNVLTIGPAGDYSFITGTGVGGVKTGSTSVPTVTLATATLPDGNVVPSFTGPGEYTLAPGNVVSIASNGAVSSVVCSGNGLPAVTLPNVDLGFGNTVSNYKGPGTYTVSPGNVLSVGPSGEFSFISGTGVNGIKSGSKAISSVSFADATLPNGSVLTAYTGPGVYTLAPGNTVSVACNGEVSSVPALSSIALPAVTSLPAVELTSGLTISSFKGPGTYTLGPGNVLTVGPSGDFSFVTGTGPEGIKTGSTSVPSVTLPAATLPDGNVVSSFTGPGEYTLAPGNVVSVASDGVISSVVCSGNGLPAVTLPNVDLGFGNTVSNYKGPGTYTVSPGNVLSVGPSGEFSFISGTGVNGIKSGSKAISSVSFADATLPNGSVLTAYTGPGVYTLAPGNTVSVACNGEVSSVPALSSIALPAVTSLPAVELTSGLTISSFKGPGTYTLGPGNVLTVGPSGDFSFVTGTGPEGIKTGSTSVPSVTLPAATLPDGNVVSSFTGPGEYTLAPGNVVSVASDGVISSVVCSGNGLPAVTLPNVDLGFGNTVSNYKGPGTYTVSPGNVLSVGPSGEFSFISGSGVNGIKTGSKSISSVSFADATLPNGSVLTAYTGPG
ncbi:hypothetical protein INT47_001048, partial [Mucor saturninus]